MVVHENCEHNGLGLFTVQCTHVYVVQCCLLDSTIQTMYTCVYRLDIPVPVHIILSGYTFHFLSALIIALRGYI